jgi:hypothetical protein
MPIFIQKANPDVNYEGKTLPRDKAPYFGGEPPSAEVPYNGLVLPEQGIQAKSPTVDFTNLPQFVFLGTLGAVANPYEGFEVGPPPVTGASLQNGGIVLPADVQIRINSRKVVSEVGILDGVEVTQHVRRRGAVIRFEFTARAYNANQWSFAQDFITDLYNKIYLQPYVIYVQNTMLNKRGITQLVCLDQDEDTVRGSINIPITMTFRENIPGKSLD